MLPPSSISNLMCIICACTKTYNLAYALCLHVYLISSGLQAHAILGNFLLSMLAEVGSMCNACRVFDLLPSRDESSWNHLINGYIKCERSRDALGMYKEMQKEYPLPPGRYTFVALLRACAKLKDMEQGGQIHARIMEAESLKSDLHVGCTLIDMYAKGGMLERAQEVFDGLSTQNVVIWNALIGGYVSGHCCSEALKHFERMQQKRVSPNIVTYVFVLKACGSLGAAEKGIELHKQIAQDRILISNQFVCSALVDMYSNCGLMEQARKACKLSSTGDVATWNALIGGYVQHELGEEALDCFKQMRLTGVTPNAITFASVLRACGSIGAVDKGREIHDEVEKKGLLKTNLFVGSGVLDMYAKCGALAKAQEVFDTLPCHNIVVWNALISGYAQHERDKDALNCYGKMRLRGISPSAITYASTLKACGSIGAIDKGSEMHAEIIREGLLTKNLFIGTALVDMYAKCGSLAKAQDVFDVLPNRSIVTWSAMITGYSQLGKAENAIVMFEKMMAEGNEPDWVVLVSVLNACNHAGLIDKAQTLFEAMRDDYGTPLGPNHHTCMVDLLGRAGQLDNAAEFMDKTPFHPSMVSWLTVMGACRKWGNAELGRCAFDQAVILDAEENAPYTCMYNIFAETDILQTK